MTGAPHTTTLSSSATSETGSTVLSGTSGLAGSPATTVLSGTSGSSTASSATASTTASSATGSNTASSASGSPTASIGTSIQTGLSGITLTTGTSPLTTTKRCEEMEAVDETTSQHIVVTPTDVPQAQKVQFQPTSRQGVSFPETEKTPTITVTFGKPAEVQSVKIPLNKTPDANVEQFEVTFYSPNGTKINVQPILSTPSANGDKNHPAHLDSSQIPSNTPVSQIDIKVVKTTDKQSPKGVVLEIIACTESFTG